MTDAPFAWKRLAAASALPPLCPTMIHVVRSRFPDMSDEQSAPDALKDMLSAGELERANRLQNEADRWRLTYARGLLRRVLGGYVAAQPAALEFTTGIGGKPALGGAHAQSGVAFNLSHSGDWVVIAAARDMHVGVDIERIRPAFPVRDIAGRFFAATETAALLALPEHDRLRAFFACWTRKEAYVKARGAGLQLGLDTFAVSLAPDERPAFHSGVEPQWIVTAFDLDATTPGALVHDCPSATIAGFEV
jgi:4'-phosphopantetheinyl transferase